MKKISFTIDGLTIQGIVFYPGKTNKKHPAILFVHGWTSSQDRSFQYAEALAALGFVCMLFDMRGHGLSDGDIQAYAAKDFLEDVLAAYDYLAALDGVDQDKISGIGSSFGCYLLAIASGKRKFSNLALRVPADYPNDVFTKRKAQNSGSSNTSIVTWRSKKRGSSETFALNEIQKFDGDVLLIESGKDTIVPRQTVLNYKSAIKDKQKVTHVVMKDAPHSLREEKFKSECVQILSDWFKARLQK